MQKKANVYTNTIIRMAVPIVLQNLLSAAVSSCDVLMLNYVGQSAISAVSMAAQYTHIITMVFYGVGAGVTVLAAQYYGKGDMQAMDVIEGIALRFAIAFGFLFAAGTWLVPKWMMRVFTPDAELIAIGAEYLRWLGAGYICWSIAEVYIVLLRSTGKVVISTALNTAAFLLNIILNAVFIFGLLGVPSMGAKGAAVATSLSRAAELLGCFLVSAWEKELKLKLRNLFIRFNALSRDFVRISLPALGNDIAWSVAFSVYVAIMGHMGSDVVAANSFVAVMRNFGTTIGFGVASVGGILVGNILGRNEIDRARECCREVIRMTLITGAIGGGLVLLSIPFVLRFASLTDQALYYLKYMMLINGYYVVGQTFNATMISGIFRAGGDTRFGCICDTMDMWCYGIPMGLFSAFVLKLPPLAVYFLICTDEFVKWPAVIHHYKKEKWLKNITRDDIYGGDRA